MRSFFRMKNAAGIFLLLVCAVNHAADNPVQDPTFVTVGKPDGVWEIVKDKGSEDKAVAQPSKMSDGMTGIKIKFASVIQAVNLTEGLFELTVKANGQGELTLKVEGSGDRTQSLKKEGGIYGYLFQSPGGVKRIAIGASVDGQVTDAAIQPATEKQKQAWADEQKSLQQFAFVTVSAQRPEPGVASIEFAGEVKPLVSMTRRAVFDDDRMNVPPQMSNIRRANDWLAANGFEKVDGDRIGVWIDERIAKEDAYGSVVVLIRGGTTPVCLFDGEIGAPRWLRYIRAGGRFVQVGVYPFLDSESPVPQPVPQNNLAMFGLEHNNWSSIYKAANNGPVTLNPAAKGWGFESTGGAPMGVPVEKVSLAFDNFTLTSAKLNGRKGAYNWFKNVRPDMPWSGLIHLFHGFNGNSDIQLRDVWRAANYVGKPVEVPALPPQSVIKPPAVKLATLAGGIKDRREFSRGEKVQLDVTPDAVLGATSVKLELLDGSKTLWIREQPLSKSGDTSSFVLDTAPYAYRAYDLKMTALKSGAAAETCTEKIGIRHIMPAAFNWQMRWNAKSNPIRVALECEDIRNAGMNGVQIGGDHVNSMDAATRQGLGFVVQITASLSPGGKTWDFTKNPEYARLDNEGKTITHSYSAGRPSIGISHPDIRTAAADSMRIVAEKVAQHPGFRRYMICNDDFSVYCGWDYAAHVLADFKAKTGLDAPRKMEKPKAYGPMPDNNPWIKWFDYCLRDITGSMNKAEMDGARAGCPDIRLGPVSGTAMFPEYVSMLQAAQYPTYIFGPNGFNLICDYCYIGYWQPLMTDTYWMDIGRMGNRDLPQWNLADCKGSASYARNVFYHYMAGGVHGLMYFVYEWRTQDSWPEYYRLGEIVRRIGPIQAELKPARRAIGILNSFSSACFDPGHAYVQAYGFHNLMQGHFDVEMVAEEEILAGRAGQYQAILLYNINYLRQSVYDALAAHAAKGGMVILDTSIPFDIPGAKRIAADIGMGKEKTLPFPPEGAHKSTPGLYDYGHPKRIALIQKAVLPLVKPWFDCPDIKIVGSRMEAGGVPYTWFVNAQDGKEYIFCRENLRPEMGKGGGTPEKVKEVLDWEKAEMSKGPYTATITLDSLPGVPYDLVSMKKIETKKLPDGRFEIPLSMERFGGELVAWLPEEITEMNVEAPKTAKPNQPVKVSASLLGGSGKTISGVLSIEFTLKDPSGKEHVVSGVCGTKDGIATWEWTPAVNDPAGEWMLTVTDLTAGKKAEQKINLSM